jgi:hypothetical protein
VVIDSAPVNQVFLAVNVWLYLTPTGLWFYGSPRLGSLLAMQSEAHNIENAMVEGAKVYAAGRNIEIPALQCFLPLLSSE